MQILTKPEEVAALCRSWHAAGEDIALVPTMGYYHAGHEDLMRHGRKLARRLVVSLFVNPTQFGPNEDFAAYPRDAVRDAEIARGHGADLLFMPEPAGMYAADHATWVEAPELAAGLCGKSRPGHFRGVCTVVLKLFNITGADYAVFGLKDWQQQAIIRRMARDLNLPVRIETRPIVREPDGLALSSRNVYLAPEERAAAPAIWQGLCAARDLAAAGEVNVGVLKKAMTDLLASRLPQGRIDYLEVVHPDSLEVLESAHGPALMACAVYLGKTRLLDNIILRSEA